MLGGISGNCKGGGEIREVKGWLGGKCSFQCHKGVTCSVAKVFLGSAKTRQAILMERLMSFWAEWSRDEAKSFLRIQGFEE